jgi:chromosome segregation ATPase
MTEAIDVLEAARRLGVTPDAVRARLRRGTLEGYRDNSGNWRVVLNDTTTDTTLDATANTPDQSRLLAAMEDHIETLKGLLAAEVGRTQAAWDEAQEARAEADSAKADQVRMARDVANMFDELRALADHHAKLHADRARLQAELEKERAELARARRSWWRRLLGA